MSENTNERGLMTDILILLCVVGLALAVIYFTGNWDKFMTFVYNVDLEVRATLKELKENLNTVLNIQI